MKRIYISKGIDYLEELVEDSRCLRTQTNTND